VKAERDKNIEDKTEKAKKGGMTSIANMRDNTRARKLSPWLAVAGNAFSATTERTASFSSSYCNAKESLFVRSRPTATASTTAGVIELDARALAHPAFIRGQSGGRESWGERL